MVKNWKWTWKKKFENIFFFHARNCFSTKKKISMIGVKMKLKTIRKKGCGRFSETVSKKKNDFTANRFDRDYPPA